mgnify:CR=1 FL=1
MREIDKNKMLDDQARELKIKRDELHLKNTELTTSETELKELNATKDKFISILGHDLKNPFHSLFGFSKLLLENHKEYDEKTIDVQLEAIYKTAKTTYELLNQILLWAQSQSGKLVVRPEKIDFIDVVEEIINECNGMAEKKNITRRWLSAARNMSGYFTPA